MSDRTSTAAALVAERARATFPARALTYLLDGGADRTHRREELERVVERDPVFDKAKYFTETRPNGSGGHWRSSAE